MRKLLSWYGIFSDIPQLESFPVVTNDLRDALTTLESLRRIAERQIGYQLKAS